MKSFSAAEIPTEMGDEEMAAPHERLARRVARSAHGGQVAAAAAAGERIARRVDPTMAPAAAATAASAGAPVAPTSSDARAPFAWSFASAVNAGIHRAADGRADGLAADADHAVARASASSGHALPATIQRKFESSLGVDLSGVRVHTGGESAAAAGAVAARAYATGQDVHFGAGHYDPSSPGGEHLLAHEIAHTVQQRGGSRGAQFKLEVTGPGDACEVEADAAADAMTAGRAFEVGGAGAGVARDTHLTPDQSHVLHTVQSQGRGLGARAQSELVSLATTLDGALRGAAGAQRQTIARALCTLYDAMDANLQRRWDAGEDTEIAALIAPFSMIDTWTADAGESRRHRRPRPPRHQGQRPQVQHGGSVSTGQPPAPAPQPPADVGHAVDSASQGTHMDTPNLDDGVAHDVHEAVHVVEGVHTLIDVATLSTALEHAIGATAMFGLEIFGAALAMGAAVAGPLAQVAAGDEFANHGVALQQTVVHFCASYARVLRGEAAVGGDSAASRGQAAAQQALSQMAAQHITPQQIAAQFGAGALYTRMWGRVTPGLAGRLAESAHGAMGSDRMAHTYADAYIEATQAGHSASTRFGGP